MSPPVLEKDSTVLVTGVNGFIASHIADQLLQDGYAVRGSVRSQAKGKALVDFFRSSYGDGRFEVVVVEDITEDGAFDEALEGISGIVHTATAATFSTNADKVIPATVAGALNIIKAASEHPPIKSVVYTSDSFAALLPQPNKIIQVSPSLYNEASVAAAHDASSWHRIRGQAWDRANAVELNVYAAAKVAAERAIWRYVSEQKPNFQLSTMLPNVNIGGTVGWMPLSSTGTFVPQLLSGSTFGLFFPAQHYLNVRDCAKLHVAALLDASAKNQRIFAMAAPFNWNDVLVILRRLRPNADVMDDMAGLGRDLSVMPNDEAEGLLRKWYGHGWTSLEESVRENIERITI